MPRISIKSTGPLLDGKYRRVVPEELRRWLRGTLEAMRDYARRIAPVDTGRYRRSIRYRTSGRGWNVSGRLYSDDVPGKVRVIEFGFPPAREGLKGRRGVYVFGRTYGRSRGLLATQSRVLASNLATVLDGRGVGRYRRQF